MCIGNPAIVLETKPNEMIAVVDYGDGVRKEVLIGIGGEKVSSGDIVIVHAGVIISKMSIEEIREQIGFFQELLSEDAKDIVDKYMALLEKAGFMKKMADKYE